MLNSTKLLKMLGTIPIDKKSFKIGILFNKLDYILEDEVMMYSIVVDFYKGSELFRLEFDIIDDIFDYCGTNILISVEKRKATLQKENNETDVDVWKYLTIKIDKTEKSNFDLIEISLSQTINFCAKDIETGYITQYNLNI